jgi:hypothetical protein
MQCDMCGMEVEGEEVVKCASCGVVLCLGCSIGGFAGNTPTNGGAAI